MTEKTTVTLQFPFTLNGIEYTELNIRRSKVKDRLAVSKIQGTDEEKEIRLLCNLCEVSPDVLYELDEKDYQELQNVYINFFKSKATSTKP